jgi:hypothetical protein
MFVLGVTIREQSLLMPGGGPEDIWGATKMY